MNTGAIKRLIVTTRESPLECRTLGVNPSLPVKLGVYVTLA